MPGISPEAIFCTLVLFIIFIVILVVMLSLRKKERCPVCGTTWIEKTPKQWISSPGSGTFNPPITFTSRFKYRCRKCQHEWEG